MSFSRRCLLGGRDEKSSKFLLPVEIASKGAVAQLKNEWPNAVSGI